MTQKKAGMTFLLLLFLTLSVALSACSGDKKESNQSETPVADDNISSKEPQYGGSVVLGISQDIDSLDQHKAVAAGTNEVLFNVYEGLVKPDKDGNLIPAVASSYESKDGKNYTFTIREGIKFHNGELVTAEDIKYSITRGVGLLKDGEPALSNIKEVKIVDEKTVEIQLEEADTEILSYLTFAIIPDGYEDSDKKPIGTGPFEFVSYTPLENLKVKKNEDYWQEGKPYLDEVIFKIVSNADTAMIELMGGNIDIFSYLTDDQAKQVEQTFDVKRGNMNLVQALFLNNGAAPFDNKLVRQAVNYAVDKQAVIDMVSGGNGTIIGTNMFPAFKKYYADELANAYTYDVTKAKELLKEAGYENGFEFTIIVPSNYQFHVDTAQVIVEQLKQVGITAKIQLVEWATWLSDVYANREYQATVVGLDAKLAPRTALERYNSEASNNFVNFNSTDYDELFKKAIGSVEEEEKIKHYKDLQKILSDEAAAVYLQDPPLYTAVNKKLDGYTFYPIYVQDMAVVYYTE